MIAHAGRSPEFLLDTLVTRGSVGAMETTATPTTSEAMFNKLLDMAHLKVVDTLVNKGMSVPEAVKAADDGMFDLLTMDSYFEGEEIEPDLGF